MIGTDLLRPQDLQCTAGQMQCGQGGEEDERTKEQNEEDERKSKRNRCMSSVEERRGERLQKEKIEEKWRAIRGQFSLCKNSGKYLQHSRNIKTRTLEKPAEGWIVYPPSPLPYHLGDTAWAHLPSSSIIRSIAFVPLTVRRQ